jgi:hypothetical protein
MTRKTNIINFRVSTQQLEEINKITAELREELSRDDESERLKWSDADVHRLALMTGLRGLRAAK